LHYLCALRFLLYHCFLPSSISFCKIYPNFGKNCRFLEPAVFIFPKKAGFAGLSQHQKARGVYKWLEKAPLRGTGKPPTRVSPTPEQSGGLFRLPFLRFFLCFRPWGAAPNPARF
jgi:hypothetical protein